MPKKIKSYSEAELIKMFGLQRLVGDNSTSLMSEWTNTTTTLSVGEQYLFDEIMLDLLTQIAGWNEEMLKMNFISPVLILGHLRETLQYKKYYELTIEAIVQGYFLKVKANMMIATGILEVPETPYFYFQEYKKQKDPKGDVTAQLLEAFLIAQELNKNDKPLYGCTVIGKHWEFVILENKTYCISNTYDCTKAHELIQIVAILRKFKEILETRMLS
ncbi:MAG: hypothetical protein ACKVTZ_09960 [Bacteroidia bacterium]